MMRAFIDTSGARWDVWEVRRDHVVGFGLSHHPVAPELQDGWLCFARGGERRRLAPYPDDWHRMNPEQLAALCERAVEVSSEGSIFDRSRIQLPAPEPDNMRD